MTRSILKKTAVVFSIVAMGFLFQNCSGGGSGTGRGSGSVGGPNSGEDSAGDGGPNSDESSSPPQPVECGEGFVGIPNDSVYNTGDFCVMKFEAKNDGSGKAISQAAGPPWVNINRAAAVAACEASSLELLTNDHWQTIARNIENVAENWATGVIGNAGGLNRGHSDNDPTQALAAGEDNAPCSGIGSTENCTNGSWHVNRRTHTLSNGDVIWDIAGNVSEWMSDNNGDWGDHDNDPATPNTNRNPVDYGSQAQISILTDASPNEAKKKFGPSGDYSSNGTFDLSDEPWGNLGQFFTSTAGGVLRGGNWGSTTSAGVFAADLRSPPSSNILPFIGFRCFSSPE